MAERLAPYTSTETGAALGTRSTLLPQEVGRAAATIVLEPSSEAAAPSASQLEDASATHRPVAPTLIELLVESERQGPVRWARPTSREDVAAQRLRDFAAVQQLIPRPETPAEWQAWANAGPKPQAWSARPNLDRHPGARTGPHDTIGPIVRAQKAALIQHYSALQVRQIRANAWQANLARHIEGWYGRTTDRLLLVAQQCTPPAVSNALRRLSESVDAIGSHPWAIDAPGRLGAYLRSRHPETARTLRDESRFLWQQLRFSLARSPASSWGGRDRISWGERGYFLGRAAGAFRRILVATGVIVGAEIESLIRSTTSVLSRHIGQAWHNFIYGSFDTNYARLWGRIDSDMPAQYQASHYFALTGDSSPPPKPDTLPLANPSLRITTPHPAPPMRAPDTHLLDFADFAYTPPKPATRRTHRPVRPRSPLVPLLDTALRPPVSGTYVLAYAGMPAPFGRPSRATRYVRGAPATPRRSRKRDAGATKPMRALPPVTDPHALTTKILPYPDQDNSRLAANSWPNTPGAFDNHPATLRQWPALPEISNEHLKLIAQLGSFTAYYLNLNQPAHHPGSWMHSESTIEQQTDRHLFSVQHP